MKSKTIVFALALAIAATSSPSFAHGGEDHSHDQKKPAIALPDAAPLKAGNEPSARLPDGSVFMPKATQNLLAIRTTVATLKDVSQTVELKGHVKANPSAGGQVQAAQSGRIVGGPNGLPRLGQAVKAGQILAWLEPVSSSLERGNQQAQLAQIAGQVALAKGKVARYAQLAGVIPQKEIDAAKIELQSLQQQQAAIGGALSQRQALVAPVSGVVSNLSVVAGQVVEVRQALFDIINPQRMIVEALIYDPGLIGNIAAVSAATASGERLNLALLGTGMELREQALPIQLSIKQPAPLVVVGQAVTVFVQTKKTTRGVAIPVAAVAKGDSGEQMVWVHGTAERFIPKKVQTRHLDANTLFVTDGLAGGERVVVQGAATLNQIRN